MFNEGITVAIQIFNESRFQLRWALLFVPKSQDEHANVSSGSGITEFIVSNIEWMTSDGKCFM